MQQPYYRQYSDGHDQHSYLPISIHYPYNIHDTLFHVQCHHQ